MKHPTNESYTPELKHASASEEELKSWWFRHRDSNPPQLGEEPWLAALTRINKPKYRKLHSVGVYCLGAAAAVAVATTMAWPTPRKSTVKVKPVGSTTANRFHVLASEVDALPDAFVATTNPLELPAEAIPEADAAGYTARRAYVPLDEPNFALTAYRHVPIVSEGVSPAPATPTQLDPAKSLLITAPEVVDSKEAAYPGRLSFGYLFSQIARQASQSPEFLLKRWIEGWKQDRRINGITTPARPALAEQLLLAWRLRDGGTEACWSPDLRNAPFRLCAIVNRLDLGAVSRFSPTNKPSRLTGLDAPLLGVDLQESDERFREESGSTIPQGYSGSDLIVQNGECRFVFCAIDAEGKPFPGGFLCILEYSMKPAPGKTDAQNRFSTAPTVEGLGGLADEWVRLSTYPGFENGYVEALANLTQRFTTLDPIPQNTESARDPSLDPRMRVRTNDGAFGPDRQFREFAANSKGLVLTLPTQSPEVAPGTSAFATLEEAVRKTPLNQINISVPARVIGGHCEIPEEKPEFQWNFASKVNHRTRRNFSLLTCNGCHAGETGTASGMHIHPREAGKASKISPFLAGKVQVSEPRYPDVKYAMQEMDDRFAILSTLANLTATKAERQIGTLLEKRRWRVH